MRSGKLVTRLDQYLFRQVFLGLVALTVGLTALTWLIQSLRFVETVINHGLSFLVFLHLTSLLIPSLVAYILPIAPYFVTEFTFYRLAGDRELTVMRAAGLSQFALARPAILVGLLATLTCFALNIWAVPTCYHLFRQYQWEIRSRVAAYLIQEGVFTPISDKMTVYLRTRDPDGSLRGILVDDARDASAHATILAERGQLIEGPKGPRVILFNGSRQEIDRQTGRLNMLTFKQNELDLGEDSAGPGQRLVDLPEVPLEQLLWGSPPNPADASRWLAEGHRRLAAPLTALSYTLIALYSSLCGAFRRHGAIVRPLGSIAAMVGLLAAGLAIGNFAARDTTWIPLIWAHATLPGLVCAWLIFGTALQQGGPRAVQRAT